MGMTLEEAIKLLKQYQGYEPMFSDGETLKHAFDLTDETVDTLLSALRPVSREQVEKVFPGCDFCKKELDDYPYIVAHSDYSSSDTCYEPGYCPICGRPLTDEAVDMVMERSNKLEETKK